MVKRIAAIVFVLIFAFFSFYGCGKKAPPKPPEGTNSTMKIWRSS